jgi:hypothetical protein
MLSVVVAMTSIAISVPRRFISSIQIVQKGTGMKQGRRNPSMRLPNQIFVSYSHKDAAWLDELRPNLRVLGVEDQIWAMDDTKIQPGEKWEEFIQEGMQSAKIGLLLVSKHFLASDFIRKRELAYLLEASRENRLRVLWIAVSASLYKHTELAHFQAVNDPSKPLDTLNRGDLESELVRICEQIKLVAETFKPTQYDDQQIDSRPHGQTVKIASPSDTTSHTSFVILYKRNATPDSQIVSFLLDRLTSKHFSVFLDQHLKIGQEWGKEIERQIGGADGVIILLSEASVNSDLLTEEVRIARDFAEHNNGKPKLLPIRVCYESPLPGELSTFLDDIQQGFWRSDADNNRVLEELLSSLSQSSVSKNAKLPPAGGAMALESEFYITRSTDREFYSATLEKQSIVLLKGARQIGKTSLLARGLDLARKAGARVIMTDFQKLNEAHLNNIETFYLVLSEWIARQLKIDVDVRNLWNPRYPPNTNFEEFVRNQVLPLDPWLVWGIDEVDRLFVRSYASEFFALLRSWHNDRANDPDAGWDRLTLAIAYATEAHLFISDLNQSPFNVGTRLTLEDFTVGQVTEFNNRIRPRPLSSSDQIGAFVGLVGGHPYLVSRGLRELAGQSLSLKEFEEVADSEDGPFGDHLKRIVLMLARDSELIEAMKNILVGRPCPDHKSFYRLRSAGLISGGSLEKCKVRCAIYRSYLMRRLGVR